jgi:hypothetical protein
MNSKSIKTLLSVLLVAMLFISNAFAEGDGSKKGNTLNKPMGSPIRAYMNINLISTVIKNTGISDIDALETNSGLVYPRGSGKTAVFESGLLWGAILNDPNELDPHVGGSTYTEGLQGGWIDASGNVIPPDDPRARIYRVRPDVFPGGPTVNLSGEASDEEISEAEVREQYELDWTQWPADLGAPYKDVDENGSYDPTIDVPGVPGADQTIWYVANDQESGLTQNLYGTSPMGIEMQTTMWAYNQTGALGSMFFRSYILINKTDVLGDPRTFDSMYVSMWSDVDLGNSTDDFAGSDTTLSLVYCYNGGPTDATYSPLPPPAVGFDFFQGPIAPSVGDSAIFKGKRIYGYKNLPMTAAYYFTRGDATVTDPVLSSYSQGAVRFYRFLKGRVGLTDNPFIDPTTGQETKFALNGNPLTGVGWVDGLLQSPGDRRIGSASGPFVMAPGDTQQVVVAEIVAGATPDINRLVAVGLLKYYDETAQTVYNNFFNVPVPPPSPQVNIPGISGEPINEVYYALDEKIVLDWGEDQAKIEATESYESQGHTFEGYNIYQFPTASSTLTEATRVATFDLNNLTKLIEDKVFDPVTGVTIIKPVQFGEDSGVRRFIEITQDALNQRPLINGIKYYFAVTAYSYNPDPEAVPRTLESPPFVFTIVPQSKLPGQTFGAEYSDTITVDKNILDPNGPLSDGMVYPIVVDPTQLTGKQYRVTFDTMTVNEEVETFWKIERDDDGVWTVLLQDQTDQNSTPQSPIVDGLQIRVQGAPLDFKGFDCIANAGGEITGAECTYNPTQVGADLKGISADWYRDVLGDFGGALSGCVETPMQLAGGYFFFTAGPSTVGDHTTMVGRLTRDGGLFPLLIPNNYEIRWTGSGKGCWAQDFHDNIAGTYDVPFELWFLGPNLDNPADDIRMIPVILDNADTVGTPIPPTFDFILDHSASGGNNDPYSEWIYFYMPADITPGDAGYQAFVTQSPTNRDPSWTEHLARVILFNWNLNQGSGGVNEQPEVGSVFRIRMTIPNSTNDIFTFTAPAASQSNDLALDQVDEINVFPNPYYGINTEELNKYNRFVTFTHLPQNAKIRIFNLAGVLIKNIEKSDDSQYLRWDLANQDGLPVASGLYIAYIDLPDLGTTKILKLAIVQEQQILDRF